MKDVEFEVFGTPLGVAMCSKENPDNLWAQSKVRTMGDDIFRFAIGGVSNKKDEQGEDQAEDEGEQSRTEQHLCIVPHRPWSMPCTEAQCTLPASDEDVRQAVLKDCDDESNSNRFNFGASQYLLERNKKRTNMMVAASEKQHATLNRAQLVAKKMAEIARARAKLNVLMRNPSTGAEAKAKIAEVEERISRMKREREQMETKEKGFKSSAANEKGQKLNATEATQVASDGERNTTAGLAQQQDCTAAKEQVAETRARIHLLETRVPPEGNSSIVGNESNTSEFSKVDNSTDVAREAVLKELVDERSKLIAMVGTMGSACAANITLPLLPVCSAAELNSTVDTLSRREGWTEGDCSAKFSKAAKSTKNDWQDLCQCMVVGARGDLPNCVLAKSATRMLPEDHDECLKPPSDTSDTASLDTTSL